MTEEKGTNKSGVAGVAIGDVARLTGISVYALRQWERRYGKSVERRDSGHRRYSSAEIHRLKLVRRLLESGVPARVAVPLSVAELTELLRSKNQLSESERVIELWLNVLHQGEHEKFREHLERDWASMGSLGFLEDRLCPFLKQVGDLWSRGELSVYQEHLISETLRDFLTQKWRTSNNLQSPEKFLLASLEHEEHVIGLHMCATVLTLSQKHVMFLGASTPTSEIVRAAVNNGVQTVCLSISESFDLTQAQTVVRELRAALPASVTLALGGGGAPRVMLPNVIHFRSFRQFNDWVNYHVYSESDPKGGEPR